MAEFETRPTNILDLDYTQLRPIALRVKSRSPDVDSAPTRLREQYPYVEEIILAQASDYTNEQGPFQSEHLANLFALGAMMSYVTVERVASHFGMTMPGNSENTAEDEWIREKNAALRQRLSSESASAVDRMTCLPEFRNLSPSYYLAAAQAIGRLQGTPVENILDFEGETRRLLAAAIEEAATSPLVAIPTGAIEERAAFMNGYGRMILEINKLIEAEKLPSF